MTDKDLWPPVQEIEVGVAAYEMRDTDLAIRTRAGIAETLSRHRRLFKVEPAPPAAE